MNLFYECLFLPTLYSNNFFFNTFLLIDEFAYMATALKSKWSCFLFPKNLILSNLILFQCGFTRLYLTLSRRLNHFTDIAEGPSYSHSGGRMGTRKTILQYSEQNNASNCFQTCPP